MADSVTSRAGGALTIPRITRAVRDADEVGFWSLRAFAIERAQAASGRTWTDYNLHDPGLTLLEAVCYAMTELVYRAQFDVADQLCAEDGAIDFERQALFAPHEIFPSRATTAADIRRVILDQDPNLQDVRLTPPEIQSSPPATSDSPRDGLLYLRLLLSDEAGAAPMGSPPETFETARASAYAAFRSHRGMGEDVDERIGLIAVQWRRLCISVDLGGSRDPEDVAADIFDVCERFIARGPTVHDLRELSAAGRSLEDIFTGPLLKSGYIDEADLSQREDILASSDVGGRPDRLPLADLRLQVLNTIDGVRGVGVLSLDPEEPDPASPPAIQGAQILVWNGDRVVPRLRTPLPTGAPAYTRELVDNVTLWRRGMPVRMDAEEVAARYADLRAGRRHRVAPEKTIIEELEAPPKGRYRPAPDYDSVANLFPPLYGLGERGLSRDADPSLVASVSQFKPYLALFDQLLASSASQLRHVKDLFTHYSHDEHLTPAPTYWPVVPDNPQVPGQLEFYRHDKPAAIKQVIVKKFDDVVVRRHQVLDYLLSLYGEVFTQNSLSQFLPYLDSVETDETLIENKAAYLKAIVSLSRDRSGGFDYGAPIWTVRDPDPTPGVHRRVALLVGFRRPRARRLTAVLTYRKGGIERDLFGPGGASSPPESPSPPPGSGSRPLEWPHARRPSMNGVEARELLNGRRVAASALFLLAVDRRRFLWRPDHHGRDREDKGGQLILGPDDEGHWWSLGPFASEAKAGHLADWLRHHVLELTAACEGLHVIEHILLRPRAAPPADLTDFALKVTLVFPAWTVRTVRKDFRSFVEETARINCPAHLGLQCLWLQMDEMIVFERAYRHWTRSLRDHCKGTAPDAVARLDTAARTILDLIARASPPSGPSSGFGGG